MCANTLKFYKIFCVVQSLQEQSLSAYDVTLGARVNNQGDQCTLKKANVTDCLSTTDTNTSNSLFLSKPLGNSGPTHCNKCEGSRGLTTLVSSPTDSYNYYAKTVLRTSCRLC